MIKQFGWFLLLVSLVFQTGSGFAASGTVRGETEGPRNPPNAKLQFKMTYSGIPIADVVDSLTFSKSDYHIDSNAKPIGMAKILRQPEVLRSSKGFMDENMQLRLNDYLETRGERKRKINVNYEDGIIIWDDSKHGGGQEVLADRVVIDPLSMIYLPYITGQLEAVEAMYNDGRQFKEFSTSLEKNAGSMTVPYGKFKVSKLVLETDEASRQRTVWYADELDNLPVKVRISNGTQQIEFELAAVNGKKTKN